MFIHRVEKEIGGFVPPTRKITFSELVEEKVVIFTGTTPEAYVQLQDTYEGLLRKKGFREQYDNLRSCLKKPRTAWTSTSKLGRARPMKKLSRKRE